MKVQLFYTLYDIRNLGVFVVVLFDDSREKFRNFSLDDSMICTSGLFIYFLKKINHKKKKLKLLKICSVRFAFLSIFVQVGSSIMAISNVKWYSSGEIA